jgi:hypothetical protein
VTLLLSCQVSAREKADVVVMKNGDRLTGEIKGLNAGVLYVNMSYILGTSSLDWSQVARVESKQLFIVRTEDGSVYKGTLQTSEAEKGRPVEIQVVQPGETTTQLKRSEVVEVAETSDKFWQRFNGAVSTGVTYSKGNENVQNTLSSDVEYLRERWSANAGWSSSLSKSSGTTTATRNDVTLSGSHLLPWKNYFYSGLTNFMQSSVQGIDLQSTVGGGIGHYWQNTYRAKVSLLGGFAWQNTQYNQSSIGAGTQNFATGVILADLRLFRFDKTTLHVNALFLPVLNNSGRVKFNTNAAYYVKIVSGLSWNVSFYGNWDSQPPPHFQGSDYGTSSGLSWTFGMR